MAWIQIRNGRPHVLYRHTDGRLIREPFDHIRQARRRAAELEKPRTEHA